MCHVITKSAICVPSLAHDGRVARRPVPAFARHHHPLPEGQQARLPLIVGPLYVLRYHLGPLDLQRLTNRTIVKSRHAPMNALITERMKPEPSWTPISGSR